MRSDTGSGGRRGSSGVSRPCARSSASSPGWPKRSATARDGSAANSPRVRMPSRSRVAGSAASSGRERRRPAGSGAEKRAADPSSTTGAGRRGRAPRAAQKAANRDGAAAILALRPSARRVAASTPARSPPWMPCIPAASKNAIPARSDSGDPPQSLDAVEHVLP